MSAVRYARLSDRGVISVTGADAEKLLQGLLTNDIAAAGDPAVFAGLLSPQGKIQFDFFVARTDQGFLLDVARDKAAELAKRLTLYRLRSKVDITDCSDRYAVIAAWAGQAQPAPGEPGFQDPRLPALGSRTLAAVQDLPSYGTTASEAAYHAHRIALGVPEGGRDYAFGDTFPHEALFDQLNGVSFSKGCYIGQEIVSRMQHRGTARKRIVQATGESQLPPAGTDITAGGVAIGRLGSIDGVQGLALVRLDRAAEFKAKGIALTAGGVPLTLRAPAFATFDLDPQPAAVQPS